MPSGIGEWAQADRFAVTTDLDDVIATGPDALMMLRVQRERMSGGFFPTAREYTVHYGLTRDRLATAAAANADLVICHPGPMNRGLEIAPKQPMRPSRACSTRSPPVSRCACRCSTTYSRPADWR